MTDDFKKLQKKFRDIVAEYKCQDSDKFNPCAKVGGYDLDSPYPCQCVLIGKHFAEEFIKNYTVKGPKHD